MLHRIDISGTWHARFSDYTRGRPHYADRDTTDPLRYLPVTVPGEIHLDLMKLGLIPDVHLQANCLAARWVEEQIWSYRRTFHTPEALASPAPGTRAWLYFEGLDYAAKIVLNGNQIATHANFFRPCRVEITGQLRHVAGTENTLAVHLDSGLFHIAEKPTEGYYHSQDSILHKRHWLRKPQCQFSWDWATRLINVGIHGRVWLEYTTASARIDALVPLVTVSEDLHTGQVTTRVFVENLTGAEQSASLEVQLLEAQRSITQTVTLKPTSALQCVEAQLSLDDPQLWWPLGHGPQSLYTLQATLTTHTGPLPCGQKRIGFRHVRINQDPHPESGAYFNIEINHRPIFCKGANIVPADMIFAAVDAARYQTLVDRAIEANFNFLRVWGGGIYEADALFDLCDQKGILLWQEFIYACSRYPLENEAFNKEARAEAVYQVRRLAGHASLIVWCGTNENEVAHWHWGWLEKGLMGPDHAFYHIILPRLLQAEDPTRYYQPSSPWSGRAEIDPIRDDIGDQHTWGIGFHDNDFRKYRDMICRFPNEGGTLGATSLPAMLACLREDQRFVQSFDWQLHDNSVDSFAEPSDIDRMTDFWLGRDCRRMSIEEFAYWAGVLQAEGLREFADNFRRRMFDSGCAVFWMFNDCWPVVRSWTIVDYFLRRTPSFYPVRRAFEPVRVVLVENASTIDIRGINDTPADVRADLRYGIFSLAGPYLLDQTTSVTLPSNKSTLIASFPRAAWKDPHSQLAFAMLSQDGKLLTRNRLILPLYKDLRWPRPDVRVHRDNGDAIFESPTFAFNVCLDLQGDELPDNFFDIFPNIPYRLLWKSVTPPKVLFTGNLV